MIEWFLRTFIRRLVTLQAKEPIFENINETHQNRG